MSLYLMHRTRFDPFAPFRHTRGTSSILACVQNRTLQCGALAPDCNYVASHKPHLTLENDASLLPEAATNSLWINADAKERFDGALAA